MKQQRRVIPKQGIVLRNPVDGQIVPAEGLVIRGALGDFWHRRARAKDIIIVDEPAPPAEG